jgi:hypothetical protein
MSARKDLRRNVSNWLEPIVRPPITEHAITCAAAGMNPALVKRAADACRRAANHCEHRAKQSHLDSAARAWREDADELRAAAKIMEKLH